MDRFLVPIPHICLELSDDVGQTTDGEPMAYANLKIGDAFTFHGWQLYCRNDPEHWLAVNDSSADVRLLDVPANHRGEADFPGSVTLLDAVLYQAIHDLVNDNDPQTTRQYIQTGGDKPELPQFRPPRWQTTPAIPVEFIKIYGVGCDANPRYKHHVYGHVAIGPHMVFWSQLIYDPECPENPARLQSRSIHDQQVIEATNLLLKENQVRLQVISDQNGTRMKDQWSAASPGVDPIHPAYPPIEWI